MLRLVAAILVIASIAVPLVYAQDIPTAYLYDKHSKELTMSRPARMSPLEPNVPLVPGNATLVAPPVYGDGEVPVWRGDHWELVEDHRNTFVYDKATGERSIIDKIGPIPETVTDIQRPNGLYKWEGDKWVKDEILEKERRIEHWGKNVDIQKLRDVVLSIVEGKEVPLEEVESLRAQKEAIDTLKSEVETLKADEAQK